MKACVAFAFVTALATSCFAGGPLYVAGTAFSQSAQGHALVWDTSKPVSYRTPNAGNLGKLSNVQAVQRVQQLFQVWQDVPTANIAYQNTGPIQATGAYSGGQVKTAAQFNAIDSSCGSGKQSPIVFDANGSLFEALGLDPAVIGFAGACAFDSSDHIVAAEVALNGIYIDGNQANGELTDNQFNQAFVHEFGHFSGLDHSQINSQVLNQAPNACDPALVKGLPIMFPIAQCQARADLHLPVLAPDDMAWISMLYPETGNDSSKNQVPFNSVYGIISGKFTFADGITSLQDVNLIAADVNQPQASAFSVVSGYLFTGNPGESLSGTNDGDGGLGSHNPALIGAYDLPVPAGTYNLQTESINFFFTGGSSVGPISFPIPIPGGSAGSQSAIVVGAGAHVTGMDFRSFDSFPRFDGFEAQ